MHRAVPAGVVVPTCVIDGRPGHTESPAVGMHAPTGTARGPRLAGMVADRPAILRTPGNAGRGKGQGIATGESLTESQGVRNLQTVLHAHAKKESDRRFQAPVDKVWREAWLRVRRNGGSADMDGWLGELLRELRDGTYAPKPVRQVMISKKQLGKFRSVLAELCRRPLLVRQRTQAVNSLRGPAVEYDRRGDQNT